LISLLAVTLSVVAMHRTRKTNNRLVELEEIHAKLSQAQLKELEEKDKKKYSADVQADLVQPSPGNYRVRVTNHGPGSAYRISVSVLEDCEYDPMVANDLESKTPYPVLASGKSFEIVATIPVGITQRIFPIALSWDLSTGKKGYRESVIS